MFIYLITNTVNGKKYVGQTGYSVQFRWKRHRESRNSGRSVIGNAVKKYGASSFTVEQIAEACSPDCLNYLEAALISSYGTLVPDGYNLRLGGDVAPAHPITREKISKSHTGLKRTPEQKQKISKALKGRRLSMEHRAKLSIAFKGNKRAKGSVRTPEMRAAISFRNKGYKHTDEFREAQRRRAIGNKNMAGKTPWNKGRKITEAERTVLLAAWVKRKEVQL